VFERARKDIQFSIGLGQGFGYIFNCLPGLQGDDLFGSTVNICAKINSKASANGMVIGNNLYQITKAFDDYVYKEVEGYGIGSYQKYSVYFITSKKKRC